MEGKLYSYLDHSHYSDSTGDDELFLCTDVGDIMQAGVIIILMSMIIFTC